MIALVLMISLVLMAVYNLILLLVPTQTIQLTAQAKPITIFNYTGYNQIYQVPSNSGLLYVQLWSGGGAGSTYQNTG